MKIPPSWQTAACGAGLFLTASAACFCAAEQLWLTAAVCVAAFVGLYASLHHRQTRQIRLLRSFIRGIRHSGLKEIPRFVPEESARALGLEREIEHSPHTGNNCSTRPPARNITNSCSTTWTPASSRATAKGTWNG